MSALTKTHRTEVRIKIGSQHYEFSDIPHSKLRTIVVSLKEYQQAMRPWRESFYGDFAAQNGEPAYLFRAARLREGLTQVDLARKLGMLQSNVSAIERGKRDIGKNLAKRAAKVFRLDYRVFL